MSVPIARIAGVTAIARPFKAGGARKPSHTARVPRSGAGGHPTHGRNDGKASCATITSRSRVVAAGLMGPRIAAVGEFDEEGGEEYERVCTRRDELRASTITELKPMCKIKGVKTSGSKSDLIDRLMRSELGTEMFILYNGGKRPEEGPEDDAKPKTAAEPAAPAAVDPEAAARAQASAEAAAAEAEYEAFAAKNQEVIENINDPNHAADQAAKREAFFAQKREERARAVAAEKAEQVRALAAEQAALVEAQERAAQEAVAAGMDPAAAVAGVAPPVAFEDSEAAAAAERLAAATKNLQDKKQKAAEVAAAAEEERQLEAQLEAARAKAASAAAEQVEAEAAAQAEADAAAAAYAAAAAKLAEAADAYEAAEKSEKLAAAAQQGAPLDQSGFAVPNEAPAPETPRGVPPPPPPPPGMQPATPAPAATPAAPAAPAAPGIAPENVGGWTPTDLGAAPAAPAAEDPNAAIARAKVEEKLSEENNTSSGIRDAILAQARKTNVGGPVSVGEEGKAPPPPGPKIGKFELSADDLIAQASATEAADAAAVTATPAGQAAAAQASAEHPDSIARSRLGANVTSIGTHFGVWAPHAEEMTLCIYGGAPDPLRPFDRDAPLPEPTRYPMTRGDDGNWRLEVQQVGHGWRYNYEVSMPGGHVFTRRDPYAREAEFETDVCYIWDPTRFAWSPFQRRPKEEYVIYQLHVGTFTGRNDPSLGTDPGTFVALVRKLDHIASMGFTAIQLLPTTEFGGAWGYNPRMMHNVHGPYGSPDDFADFIDAAHKRGIAVFVDVALHHGAANGNSLWEYDGWGPDENGGIYFERSGDTGWGQGFAFWKGEVKSYLAGVVDTWLGEYNVDGIRIDSAHSMSPDLCTEVTRRCRENYPDRFVVAEHNPEGAFVVHDLGADSVWLLSGCDDAADMTWQYNGNFDQLEYMVRLKGGYGGNAQCVKYLLGSHDQCGKRPGHSHDLGHWVSRFGGRGEWRARASARLWWGVMCAGQGLPMMFMGTEVHQDGHWHTGDDEKFDWGLLNMIAEKGVDNGALYAKQGMAHVKAANEVRVSHKALTMGNYTRTHRDDNNGILACERYHEDPETGEKERMIVVVNAGDGQWDADGLYGIAIGNPWENCAGFEEVYNSQSAEFGGWENSGNKQRGIIQQDNDQLMIQIPKMSVQIFKMHWGEVPPQGVVLDENHAKLAAAAAQSISALQ